MKGKGEQQQKQVATSTETKVNEFAAKFEKDFSLVSYLSTSTIPRNVWYVDSGASRHMTSTWQLFSSLKKDSWVQVELGDDAKYLAIAVGTISF